MPKTSEETENLESIAGYVRDENGNLIPDYDMTMVTFDDGDVVSGEVVRIDRDEILVDIGYKSEGVIPIKELAVQSDVDPKDVVSIGEKIDALVLQKEDADGRLILSKKRAEYEKAWMKIQELFDGNEFIDGRVIEIVKGGLILDIGLRGFLPASLVDIRRVKDLNDFIGQNLECKIIEVNRNRNNVVLSRRAVIEEEKKEQREQVIDGLAQGQIVKGCVSSIVTFGVFVDLDGIDGLIHISELSWDHIEHPSEILSIGDEVEVQILDINKSRQRVSLGYKQLHSDPWSQSVSSFAVGDETNGKVSRIVPYGMFITVCDGIEGLVHVSEFENENELRDSYSEGQEITIKIMEIDAERRRLSLSVKQTLSSSEAEKAEASTGAEASSDEISEEIIIVTEEVAVETAEPEATINMVESTETDEETVSEEKIEDSTDEKVATKTIRKKNKKTEDTKVEDTGDDSLEAVLAAMKNELGSK